MTKLTRQQRADMAAAAMEAAREECERHGEVEGDWADGERYLRDDASDEELKAEYAKYFPG